MLIYYTLVLSTAKLTPLHLFCRQNQNSVLLCTSFNVQETENVSGKFVHVNDMYIMYATLMFCKNLFSYKIDDNF
jgi:hypothetical protein